ncbi:MAG: hypothetical protein R3C58_16555, partial [Parvularculaceae bacterium]
TFAGVVLYQIAAVVHLTKHYDGPHQHHGQECVLSHHGPGGDKAIVAAALSFFVALAVWRIGGQTAQTEVARIAVRAARPRGPPLH